jgi:hypothetical protein
MRSTGSLLLVVLVLCGCCSSSRPHHGRPDESARSEDDHLVRLFDAAIKDFGRKVSEQRARGWAPTVPLSSDEPRRPVARVDRIRNDTHLHVDTRSLTDRLGAGLVDQGLLKVVASPSDLPDSAMEEETLGAQDVTSFLVTGRIESGVTRTDGARTTTLVVSLRLVDVRTREVVIHSRSEGRQVVEER